MNRIRWRAAVLLAATALLSLGGVGAAFAAPTTTYHVSPTGSDAGPGSAARPYKTVQKCATVMRPGDSCEIAGGTYRETVTPARNGNATAPITYRAAPGSQVTITGADTLAGWSQVTTGDLAALTSSDGTLAGSGFAAGVTAGKVYRAPVTLNPALTGNQVFVDGGMQPEAQWPYPGSNILNPTLASAQSGTVTTLNDTALTQPAGFWVGARLTAHNWFVSETGRVTSSAVGSVTAASLPDCVGLNPNGGTFYSLSGKLSLLAHAGSWFYDPSSHTMYLWTQDGTSPAGHSVEVKQRTLAFDLSGRSHIAVTGLNIRSATIKTSAASTNVTLDRINAQYLSSDSDLAPDPAMVTTPDGCAVLTAGETTSGIQLAGSGNTLANSVISWSSGNGVVVSGTGNTVTNTSIMNVDYLGSYAAGINLLGANHTITHNTVSSTGRSSINIDHKVAGSTHSGTTIAYNDLSGYNTLVDDGGAIYACCSVNLATTVIHHNQFHDPSPHSLSAPSPGVYLDLGAYNATVYNNVAWNRTTYGAVLINPGDASTSGNRIYNNTSGTDTNVASTFGGTYTDTELTNNIGVVGNDPGVTATNNLVPVSSAQFTDPSAYDFTLTSTSPARNAGVVRPPATNGFLDPQPSIGAYQYGVPKWTAGAPRSGALIQAESYSSSSGVSTHAAATGTVVGSFDGGDWIGYTGVAFGTGRDLFTANVGVDDQYAGQPIQIRLDSPTGPVVGALHVSGTGGFDTVSQQSTPIAFTTGTHDVYLVAAGTAPGFGNLDSFRFSAAG